MGYVEMNVARVKDGGVKRFAFEYEQILSGAGNGDWILIPDDIFDISVTVAPTTCTAKVQLTTDKISEVKTGTPTAIDWDAGLVGSNSEDVFYPVTAIRLVQAGIGSSKLKVRVQ